MRERLAATLGFAAAVLLAPAVGGLLTGIAPVMAAVVISALTIAYGSAITPCVGLPARVPRLLTWIIVGYASASLVHLGATALLNLGALGALAIDVVGAIGVVVASRRWSAAAGAEAAPAGAAESVTAGWPSAILVLLACAALATLWARETITALPQAAATGVFPAWQDYFLHASEISYARDYPAFERHSQYLTAVPQPLYHRGSYALAALFSALGDVPSLAAATAFWLPTGLLLCVVATYAWGAAMGGAVAGVGAVAAVFLAPDASSYGFANRFLSFHWLLQMAGGSSYALALVLVALMRIVTAPPGGAMRALVAAAALTLASAAFRVHVSALATGMVCVFALLSWRPRVRLAGVMSVLVVVAAVAGGLLWLESVALAPHFLSARARPLDFFLSVHTQASALPSPWVDWTAGHGAVWKVVLGYAMMLVAGCGLSLAVLAGVWRGGVLARMGWHVAAIPVALAIAHGAVILLVPTPAHGDPTDFGHRPFVLVYLVVAGLAGAGLACGLSAWSVRRYATARPARMAVAIVAVAGLVVPWRAGERVQQRWTAAYAEIPVAAGTMAAGAYVRAHSSPGELVLAASEDPLAVLVALTERRAYLSRTALYRSLGPDTAAVTDTRAAEHGAIAGATSFEQLRAFGAAHDVAWYVADTPATHAWPTAVTSHSVFSANSVRVYDLR